MYKRERRDSRIQAMATVAMLVPKPPWVSLNRKEMNASSESESDAAPAGSQASAQPKAVVQTPQPHRGVHRAETCMQKLSAHKAPFDSKKEAVS